VRIFVSAVVAGAAVMFVMISASSATTTHLRSYGECRDLAYERGFFSPGTGRRSGWRGRFIRECRHGRQV
jgi:hypothetical protein